MLDTGLVRFRRRLIVLLAAILELKLDEENVIDLNEFGVVGA